MSNTTITLTASMRQNLLSLQQTSDLMSITQNRISTGKKVNSATDDPTAYFTATALTNRASDLDSIKSSMQNSITTVQTAVDALSSIGDILKQMKGLAESARASSTASERASYKDQFDALRTEIDHIAGDASFNGVNLLKATPDTLKVNLNEKGTTYDIDGIASDSAGLSVTAANDWDNATVATGTSNIDGDLTKIATALATVRTTAANFGSNVAFMKTRTDFTTNMINNLKAGAGNLVNADGNEEAANLLALQTRQSMGIQAISMANQANQSILSLFR